MGGDHRGDEAVWSGWIDRCIDKGCRLHSALAAYPISLALSLSLSSLFFISGLMLP